MKTRQFLSAALLAASLLGLAGCAANPADKVPKAGVNTPAPATSPAAASSPAATATALASATPGASASPGASATPGASPAASGGTAMPFAEGTEVKFVGSKVTGSHNGGFRKVTGSVTVPPDGDLTKAVIDVNIDMSSTYSDDEKLTGHLMAEDFFHVSQYPTSTFKSTAIAKTDGGYLVTGDLTLRGVTQSINIPAEIALNSGQLTAKSEFSINRKLFKIEYPGKPDNLIRDEVVISFDIKAGAAQ
jgi:polyisoprenoid-binding protein YceI